MTSSEGWRPVVITAAPPARTCVMLSGSGRTLVNLADRVRDGTLPAALALVIASRECPGAARARERGIPTEVVPGTIEAARLAGLLRAHAIELVVLAGYLRLVRVPPGFEGRVVNIHPALLPDFGGAGMFGYHVHEAVLASGASRSGCTVHLCDDRYDTGPILLRRECPVHPADTPESLAARVFELECEAYPAALRALISGKVELRGGEARIVA